jgi:hypothetical protein
VYHTNLLLDKKLLSTAIVKSLFGCAKEIRKDRFTFLGEAVVFQQKPKEFSRTKKPDS